VNIIKSVSIVTGKNHWFESISTFLTSTESGKSSYSGCLTATTIIKVSRWRNKYH
jgi:hypothetical protein